MTNRSPTLTRAVRLVHFIVVSLFFLVLAGEKHRAQSQSQRYKLRSATEPSPRPQAELELLGNTPLSNSRVILFIGADGRFTMQTNGRRWLLYPYDQNGTPRTTYLTVRVDGNDYDNNDQGRLRVDQPLRVDNSSNTAQIGYTAHPDISITQHFEFAGPAVRFVLELRNNGRIAHSLGVRYLFDTQVDENDGAPLYASSVGVRTYETDLPSPAFREFFAYDHFPNPTLISQATLETTPARIVFAYWPEAYPRPFDYIPDPNRPFFTSGFTTSPDSDSCVLVYYLLGTLAPGAARQIVIYYGTSAPVAPQDRRQRIFEALTKLERAMNDSIGNDVEIAAHLFSKLYERREKLELWEDTLDLVAAAFRGISINDYFLKREGKTFEEIYGKTLAEKFTEIFIRKIERKLESPDTYFKLFSNLFEAGIARWLADNMDVVNRDPEGSLRNYLETMVPIPVTQGQSVYGLASFRMYLSQVLDTTKASIPNPLPENYPADFVVASINRLASDYVRSKSGEVKSGYYSDAACYNLILGAIPKGRSSIEQTVTVNDVNKLVKVGSRYALVGLLITKGAIAITGVGLPAIPIIQSYAVPSVSAIREVNTYTTIALKWAMIAEWVELQSALAGELHADLIVAGATKRLVTNVVLTQAPLAGLRRAESTMVGVGAFSVSDLVFEPDEFVKRTMAIVSIRNEGDTAANVQTGLYIYANRPAESLLVGGGLADSIKIPARTIISVPITAWVMRSDQFGTQSYVAELFMVSGLSVIGPRTTVFGGYARGAPQAQASISTELSSGSLMPGQRSDIQTQISHTRVDFVLSHVSGDLDLHIRDSQGRHVGVNYQSGQVEIQIPGASYSGTLSNPEIVSIVFDSPPQGTFDIETVGLEGETIQFSVSKSEMNRTQPALSVIPASFNLDLVPGSAGQTTFSITEISSQEGIDNLQVKLTDFKNEQGTSLSSSSVTLEDPPPRVVKANTVMMNLIVVLRENAAPGRYSGSITVTGTSSLSRASLSVPVPVSVTVGTVAGSDPKFEWIDATPVSGGAQLRFMPQNFDGSVDQDNQPIALAFNFRFFDTQFAAGSQLNVCTNGWASFTDSSPQSRNFPIPDGRNPSNLLSVLFTDLFNKNNSESGVFYRTLGASPNRQFVIEWLSAGRVSEFTRDAGDRMTFELILYEGSNDIKFQYRDLIGNDSTGSFGTIGLQGDARIGVPVSFNQAILKEGKVFVFSFNRGSYQLRSN